VLRDQPELFGRVASTPAVWRILAEELPADPRGTAGLRSALARVREQAWVLGAAPRGPLILDVDATLIEAHSPATSRTRLQTIDQKFRLPLLGNAGDTVQVGNLSSLFN
jgi:hypothetical protein